MKNFYQSSLFLPHYTIIYKWFVQRAKNVWFIIQSQFLQDLKQAFQKDVLHDGLMCLIFAHILYRILVHLKIFYQIILIWICYLFKKNVKIVESCIKAVVKWAPLLYIALIPFKILINNLEGDHVTSGYIYGFCRSAMIVLEQHSIKYTWIKEVKQKLIQLIMKRLDCSKSGHLYRVLFHLTTKGRYIYTQKVTSPDQLN